MSFEPEFMALFTDTVTLTSSAGQDDYGAALYTGPPAIVSAFVEYAPRLIQSAIGKTVVSRARVFLPPTVAIHLTDRLTLPQGEVSTILRIDQPRDEDGRHHAVVYV